MAASGWNPTAFTSAAAASTAMQTALTQSGVSLSQNLNADALYAVALANLLVGVPSTMSLLSSSPSLGIGYAVGAGTSTTQITGKTTAYTANGVTGKITFATGAMPVQSVATATFFNSSIQANDILVLSHVSGGTIGAYTGTAAPVAGSAQVTITNISSSALTETPVFSFAIVRTAIT